MTGIRTSSPKRSRKTETQITDRVGKSEFNRLAAGPIFAGEQILFRAFEARAPAVHDQRDEVFVNLVLDCLEPFDVFQLLGQERIEGRLAITRCIDPAFDPKPLHELGKAKRCAHDTNRTKDRRLIANDLVTPHAIIYPPDAATSSANAITGSLCSAASARNAEVNQVRLRR